MATTNSFLMVPGWSKYTLPGLPKKCTFFMLAHTIAHTNTMLGVYNCTSTYYTMLGVFFEVLVCVKGLRLNYFTPVFDGIF